MRGRRAQRAEQCSTNKPHVWIQGTQFSYPASINIPRESCKLTAHVTEMYV